MSEKPGNPYPLGATWDGQGVNFSIFSERATGVDLCLIDEAGGETRIALKRRTGFVWHCYLTGLGPGQRYAYRVHGPYEPERGLRFNSNVRLIDPYAKALSGLQAWNDGSFAYDSQKGQEDLAISNDDATGAPLSLVIDPRFDWANDQHPNLPFHELIVYEAHVRGLTLQHPDVPKELRGTYLGMCQPAIIDHLKQLGITAIELMPIHAFVDDQFLLDKGLRNYWGYNTIGFFAPDPRFRAGDELGSEVVQFKELVRALHAAGIEVILDVVYNHTAEGNHLGPTMSFRGIDNPSYYRLVEDEARYYMDYTGTGNTLNVRHPQTLQLMMDSLRYWVHDMHVDGFRFDLAAALARSLHEVDQLSSFFMLIHQDPTLSQIKMIAEPWDVGPGGYQVGNFPIRWAEWNGRYRDSMRAFWRGDGGLASELAYRLTGSSDIYENDGRKPYLSINFVTCHDGFTLADLVSYSSKHNEDNGEDNRDGNDNNLSFNCGTEGPTRDPGIRALRAKQQRNLLATLLLSQGTPMISHGDELGRTQQGNNNGYCQDNALSWVDWQLDDERRSLLTFTQKLSALRRAHPVLRRATFFKGRPLRGSQVSDLVWLRHDGADMSDEDWNNPETRSLGLFLAGEGIDEPDSEGNPIRDDDFLLLVNSHGEPIDFSLPFEDDDRPWELLVDTANDRAEEQRFGGDKTSLAGASLRLLFRRRRP
ncbi:MAG TPA: glycogen debranching protein GlgX [Polyangiaceae bacterium]|nr:glycogen debranching protein GlgX [Polyangiaceae bacterium]